LPVSLKLGQGGRMSQGRLVALRVLPIGILGLAVVAVPVMIFSPTGLDRLRGLRDEKRRVEQEVSRLSVDIEELRAEVQRIKSDPSAVEQVARDELGLVRKTEVVFQFKD
jgi:cell division protein FtsB